MWAALAGLALILLVFAGARASAEAVATPAALPDVPAAESFPLFAGERTMRGENARDDSFFEIGKGLKATTGSYVDLYFGHSAVLIPKASTLTVMMDDVPLGSIALDETNVDTGYWRVDLSALQLESGFHKLSLWAHMAIVEKACANPENGSNWIKINPNSQFHLNLLRSYDKPDLTYYPSPFFEKGSQSPLRTMIVVPDQVESDEFAAAARLVQFFSSQATDKRLTFPVYMESQLTDALLRDNQAIWLGKPDRWKERGKLASAEALKTAGAAGAASFIGLAASPWNAGLTNLIVAGGAAELANAATILSDETLYSQLRGGLSAVPAELKKPASAAAAAPGAPYTVSFEKLGYGDLTVQGTRQGSARISYPLPAQWDVNDGAELRLQYRHSKSLQYGASTMTVRLNGTPVESRRLGETTADGGELTVQLPLSVIGTSRTLEIEVAFELSHDSSGATAPNANCGDDPLLGNWAIVDKASTLTFTPIDKLTMNLQSLPYPFVANGRWSRTTFVFPEQITAQELTTAMTWIGIVGRGVQDNTDLTIARASAANLKEQLKDRNVVYAGLGKTLPDFLNGFAASAVAFKEEQMLSNAANVPLLQELQTRSAVLQMTRSPLNDSRGLLLLAATSADREGSLTSALVSPLENVKISGKAVVIDSKNIVHAFAEDPPPPRTVKSKTNAFSRMFTDADQAKVSRTAFIAVFIVIVVLVVVTLVLPRRRRR